MVSAERHQAQVLEGGECHIVIDIACIGR
jgi:hypothetical protein